MIRVGDGALLDTMVTRNFISQENALDLVGNEDVSFVDGSWYLKDQHRNGRDEFLAMRIPGAVFFDIDAISDQVSDLPHMLPSADAFSQAVSALGLSRDKQIIVYDGPGLFSAPRVWWTLKTMGADHVSILEGGFDTWKANTYPVETGNPNPARVQIFSNAFDASRVASKQEVEETVAASNAIIIDARPIARFDGTASEPRPGLRSGHIPGSKSLPASALVTDGRLKPKETLDAIFNDLGIGMETPVITTCGSGVTAAILTLALEETGRKNHKLFDGSWAEWGRPGGPDIETS